MLVAQGEIPSSKRRGIELAKRNGSAHTARTGDAYCGASDKFICTECKTQLFDSKPGPRRLWSAFKRGSIVALGGTIVWGTIAYVTGYELALIAIAIGYVVGAAVRKGSAGLGGRRYQVLAVALTYLFHHLELHSAGTQWVDLAISAVCT